MYSGRVVSKSLLKRSLPILSHNGRGQNHHNNNNNYSNMPHTVVNAPHPQGPPAPIHHPHQPNYNNLPKYSKVSKKLQQFPHPHHMITPPPLINIGNFLPQQVPSNPSAANIAANAPPVIFQHKAVSHTLPGRVMRIDEWHPNYRDNGVLVEYLQAHERHLGILDKPLDAAHWLILTAAPTHCSLRDKRAVAEEVPRVSVPCREVTFQWPQHHMNTLYRYRVEDLPELLHMCQELVEKYRDQVPIAWGAHIDHHRDYAKHHYHHALLANFLFGQVPKPHEYYIAQRLLVESTRYFTPTADPLYFSVNSPQHVQNFNKPRASETAEPASTVASETTAVEVARDGAKLDDIEGTRQFVRRLVKRLQHKYPRARDHDAQRARDQSVVVAEEWNPVADKALIDELKCWALNSSSVNERLPSAAENSRVVRHTTMMVHERLIEPLCRGLGIGTTPRDIFDVLTSLGVWHRHENLNLHRYPYKWQFSAQELQHYAHLATLFGPSLSRDSSASQVCVDKDHAVRVDMRQQCPVVVSVDNSTEQLEVDDAVSLEHVPGTDQPWIWIHIADPSRCVTPNSAVDLLARERVSSIYLPERARDPITMFPAPLISHNFNLLHDHTNYALSFGIRLREDGQVDEYVIVPSIIPPIHKRTYALVDDWLHADWVPRDSEQAMLHELYALSQRRRAYRARCGAVASTELPRPEISVLENGAQIEISMVPEHESRSRALISELMILVGDITADFAKRHAIPIPYRSPVPDQPSKYTYCVRPPSTPHSALALPLYTQVTSPIRRYHDLLVHHQIKAHLRGEELPFSEERVAAILHEMEPVLREITKLNQYSVRYWMLRYLEQQPPHRKYTGKVLAINTAASESDEVSVYVYLLEVGLRANVMLNWLPKVHQHLTLRVNSVDAFYNLIHLSEVPK